MKMKYLKYFENLNDNEFKVGDHILVNSEYNELFHEIVKIVFINKDLSRSRKI